MKNFIALCAISTLVLASCFGVSNKTTSSTDSVKSAVHVDSSAVMTHTTTVSDTTKH
jgi:hypothetical protein